MTLDVDRVGIVVARKAVISALQTLHLYYGIFLMISDERKAERKNFLRGKQKVNMIGSEFSCQGHEN